MQPRLPRQLRHKCPNVAIFYMVWVPPAVVLYALVADGSINWWLVAITTVLLLSISCPIAWLMDLMVPIAVTQYGLTSYTWFGLKKEIAWDRIVGAKRMIVFPSLTYLAVLDGSWYFNRALIPRFSTGQREFHDDVVAMAGPEHPLAVALRREGFDKQPLLTGSDRDRAT